MDDTELLNQYFKNLHLNKSELNSSEAEFVFKAFVKDFIDKKINDSQLGNLTGDLFFAQKITNQIEGDLPKLAELMDVVSELSWDKENNHDRYQSTIKKIHTYAKLNFID